MADQSSNDAWITPGLAQLFEIVLDAADEQRDLTLAERDAFFGAGRVASESGRTLSSVIEAFFGGAGQLWEQVFVTALPSEAVEIGRALRRVSETAVGALAAGFEAGQRQSIRAQEAIRREFLDDVLSGMADATHFADQAEAAGFPVAATYVVAVIDVGRQLADAGPFHSQVERELQGRAPQRRLTSFTKGGRLVVVAPDAEPTDLGLLRNVLDSISPVEWRAGVGEASSGADGINASYQQGLEAVMLGRLFGLEHFTYFDDLLPFRMMVADRTIAQAMFDTIIVPLRNASRGSLLETFQSFIDSGGNMAETARRLSVGPRTVAYRLDRIAEVTGRSPRDPEGRLTLELALRCQPLVVGHVLQ